MREFFIRLFNGPIWIPFLLMGVFGGISAVASYNLATLFIANFGLISRYGVMGLIDGGLLQLVELIVYGYVGIAFYILFKGCLYGVLGHFMKH